MPPSATSSKTSSGVPVGFIVLRFALTLELKFGYAAEADLFWDHADAGSL